MAKAWRDKDHKHWTESRIAKTLGVAQPTVSGWLAPVLHNIGADKVQHPDARVKLNKAAQELAVQRVQAGETQTQVAADLHVDKGTISRVVKTAAKKAEQAAKEAEALEAVSGGEAWTVTADQAVVQCQAVITDPPYSASAPRRTIEAPPRWTTRNSGWPARYSSNARSTPP